MYKIDIGKAIRRAMFDADEMSAETLARKYGCTVQYASELRRHGPKTIEGIAKCADIFNIKPSELVKKAESSDEVGE